MLSRTDRITAPWSDDGPVAHTSSPGRRSTEMIRLRRPALPTRIPSPWPRRLIGAGRSAGSEWARSTSPWKTTTSVWPEASISTPNSVPWSTTSVLGVSMANPLARPSTWAVIRPRTARMRMPDRMRSSAGPSRATRTPMSNTSLNVPDSHRMSIGPSRVPTAIGGLPLAPDDVPRLDQRGDLAALPSASGPRPQDGEPDTDEHRRYKAPTQPAVIPEFRSCLAEPIALQDGPRLILVVQPIVQQGARGELLSVPRIFLDPAVQLPNLLIGELAVEVAMDQGPRIVGHVQKPSWAAFFSTHSRNISRIR